VVRARIYVTEISNRREAGDVHSEFFESIRPATTMVQVAKPFDDQALVESQIVSRRRVTHGRGNDVVDVKLCR
jgi:hypothetical protein